MLKNSSAALRYSEKKFIVSGPGSNQVRQALVELCLVLEDEGRVDGAAVPEVFVGSLLGSIL